MNKRRLLKLADLLEADAANPKGVKFDLATWAEPAGSRTEFKNGWPTVGCGTAACAVGLACISGAFRSLKYEVRQCGYGLFGSAKQYIVPITKVKPEGLRDDGERCGFDAVNIVFGLKFNEADWLFDADAYPERDRKGSRGERAVARRIRDFVAGKARPA